VSDIPPALRRQVVARAGSRCEYCRLPTVGQAGPFPIDHVDPQSAGGLTVLANLALSCPRCNGHKWAHRDGRDPVTGATVPLFNPRTQRWSEHFRWSEHDPVFIEGVTACGRATVARLQMNAPEVLDARRWLRRHGVAIGRSD